MVLRSRGMVGEVGESNGGESSHCGLVLAALVQQVRTSLALFPRAGTKERGGQSKSEGSVRRWKDPARREND